MILYKENPKEFTQKKKKKKNYSTNSVKLAGYKINIQKLVAFLCTNNKLSEKEIKKIIPFRIAPKRIKYLSTNLINKAKNLYTKNHKTLMKEIKEDTYK